jgi:osmotically-inducible protein OsmY
MQFSKKKGVKHVDDLELKKAVESELNFDPSINAAEIGVAAKDGIVTVSGGVPSYWEKVAAERAAARVVGVKAVVNQIEVRLPGLSKRTDEDIARAAIDSLKWNVLVPSDRIKVKVSKGRITLEGTVHWQYQRSAAEKSVRKLVGVKGVTNLITVSPEVRKTEVKSAIESALKRLAEVDATSIKVDTEDGKVVLSGTVRSWFEREEAERAAWAAPGVRNVEDRIAVAARS